MGDEEREGAARSQHVVLQGPADARTMAAAMRPGVERSRNTDDRTTPGCVIITPTVEQALAASDQARLILADESARVVPVSQVARARRVLAGGPAAVVAGTAADLLALRTDSALPLQGVRAMILIGLDDLLAQGDAAALEALLADAPTDAMRVATIDADSPAVDAFLDAQLRRARRIAPPPAGDAPLAVTPSFIITANAGRADTLRAVLDAIDPPSLVVVTNHDDSANAARHALARLGLAVDGLLVQVVRQPTAQHVSLVVFWDAPVSADSLSEALATKPVDAVALLAPEELPAFMRLTHNTATAFTAPARRAAADSRVQRLRAAIRSVLDDRSHASASELALLTPLLDEYDAVEIAAAALRLYEGAQLELQAAVAAHKLAAHAATQGAPRSGMPGKLSVVQGGAGGKQRVFLAVGKRDNVRVGDIVGAVANEAGIPGDAIGSVELYESHTTVELSADDAARAVSALSSATLRGRKLNARIDERSERDARPPRSFGPPRSGGRDGGREGGRPSARGDRPFKGKPRGEGRPEGRGEGRSEGRGERPESRGPRGGGSRGESSRGESSRGGASRGSFGATEARRAFGDRPVRERTESTSEWSQRGGAMKNAKRPSRPRTERTDEG